MISDGDSSSFKKIKEVQPNVVKIECTNHLLRNFCNKLTTLSTSSSNRQKPLVALKKTIASRILKWRTGIKSAIHYRQKQGISEESVMKLKGDVKNSLSHIFGEHKMCKELGYFCDGNPKPNETNYMPLLVRYKKELLDPMLEILGRLIDNSNSLILNVTNNPAETYNAVACLMVGSKRVNYTGSGGYHARNSAAVISYNNGKPFELLHQAKTNGTAGIFANRDEETRLTRKLNRKKVKKSKKIATKPNADYGGNVEKPDLSQDLLIEKRGAFIEEKILKNVEEIEKIENDTKDQSDNAEWYVNLVFGFGISRHL